MADTKISQLIAATAINSGDVVPIVQVGVNKKADVDLFKELTTNEKAAVNGANNPSVLNVFATIDDLPSPISTGDLTTTTTGVTITGGVGSVVGSGTTINVQSASVSQNGLLTKEDWAIFNGKQNSIVSDNGTVVSPVSVRDYNVDTAKTFKINNVDVIKYQSANNTTATVGGITAGTNLQGLSPNTILNMMLEPFIPPTFASFTISAIPTTIEVGNKIVGSHTFSWTFTNGSLITDNTLDITDTVIPYSVATNISKTSPLIFDFTLLPDGGVDMTTPGTYTWQIRADYVHPVNGVTSITRNFTTSYQLPKFSGSNANQNLTNPQILALTKVLSSTGLGTYTFSGNGYFHLYVEQSLPQPTLFKDQATGFAIDVSNAGVVAVTTDYGLIKIYNHYVSQNYLVSSFVVVAT